MNEQAWRTAIALAILLALTWGALTAARIDLRRELVVSVLRALAQLLVVALVIAWIFSHPQWAVAYLVIMVLAAAFTANRRIGGDLRDGGAVLLAIAVGASATVAVVGSVGAIDLSAQEMLPFAAQMIGGTMAAASVAGLRLRDDVQAGLPAFEGYLALGATDRQAGLEFGRRATGRTLLPGLDQTKSAGLVTLPGAFVGLLIGGATPLLAAQIQLLVLVGLLLAQTVAGVLTTRLIRPVARPRSAAASTGHPVLSGPADPSAGIALVDVGVSYGSTTAVDKVSVDIAGPGVTVLVGPSGCGKSSLLREMNRMNDAVADARSSGVVLFRGQNVQETDAVELRRAVGMVFQRPNVFPSSIRDNVAYGPRLRGIREGVDDLVRECLVRAALWEEVKDRLDDPASSLSIGQQQRLTIGRCLALDPEVILMDEPTSALDPVATEQIELLIRDLGRDHLVVVTSHNRDQIRRIADHIVYVDRDPTDASRPARLIEHGTAERLLSDPRDARTRAFLQAH